MIGKKGSRTRLPVTRLSVYYSTAWRGGGLEAARCCGGSGGGGPDVTGGGVARAPNPSPWQLQSTRVRLDLLVNTVTVSIVTRHVSDIMLTLNY